MCVRVFVCVCGFVCERVCASVCVCVRACEYVCVWGEGGWVCLWVLRSFCLSFLLVFSFSLISFSPSYYTLCKPLFKFLLFLLHILFYLYFFTTILLFCHSQTLNEGVFFLSYLDNIFKMRNLPIFLQLCWAFCLCLIYLVVVMSLLFVI